MNAAPREISVQELDEKLKNGDKFAILDVREPWELDAARIKHEFVINIPLSLIGQKGELALPPELRSPEAEVVVMCHHGVRSANVTIWMAQNGWKNASSLAGGIDAYARQIDPDVGFY